MRLRHIRDCTGRMHRTGSEVRGVYTITILKRRLGSGIEAELVVRLVFDTDASALCSTSVTRQRLEDCFIVLIVVGLGIIYLLLSLARWARRGRAWRYYQPVSLQLIRASLQQKPTILLVTAACQQALLRSCKRCLGTRAWWRTTARTGGQICTRDWSFRSNFCANGVC